ncbi:hypothetical protein F383_35582 [Gossypium arboreum]|uniref:Uncharacterized protein n=1 Tax=Gossypium arboreum TaxID=29729 RepID=A0A0B0N6N5_GOSAR|nr:hypothetical protein F383_35582 [Gossypium arboreum]
MYRLVLKMIVMVT